MESDQMIRNLKIVIILALIIAVIGAVFYLVYGFTILWQGMAAGIIIGFLLIVTFLFLALSVYFWIKMLILKRELRLCKNELKTELNRRSVKIEAEPKTDKKTK